MTCLRLLAALRADVLRDIVRAYAETIHRWMRRRLQRPGAAAGSIAATHRGGGALNLSPHLHVLTADGVFARRPCLPRACRGAGEVGFRRVPAPSPADLRWVVETVRRRVLRRLARMGLLRDLTPTATTSSTNADTLVERALRSPRLPRRPPLVLRCEAVPTSEVRSTRRTSRSS